MKNVRLKKLTLSAILCALSLIAFSIENLFPPLFLPGARMGIANIFILLAIVILGWKYALVITLIKVILGSVFTGNVSAILYSLPAGLISISIEIILINFTEKFSITAISVLGAVVNIIVQNFVFFLITEEIGTLSYLPYLAIISSVSGAIIGFAVYLILKSLPYRLINYNNHEKKEE